MTTTTATPIPSMKAASRQSTSMDDGLQALFGRFFDEGGLSQEVNKKAERHT